LLTDDSQDEDDEDLEVLLSEGDFLSSQERSQSDADEMEMNLQTN